MRNKLTDELAVCGLNAALAVGQYHPQTINRLFLREDRLKLFTGICKQLAERKRPYKICEDEELERICKSVHHQGVVAMIEEPVIEGLSAEDLDLWAAEGKTGVVLHSVCNDHNLGAIARAAAFFDVSFIVLNEKDSALNKIDKPSSASTTEPSSVSSSVPLESAAARAAMSATMSESSVARIPPETEDGVFLQKKLQVENPHGSRFSSGLRLTTSAYRIAEGGFEHLTVRKVSNTEAFLKDASKRLITLGTDTRARMRISDLSSVVKGKRDAKRGIAKGIALVLGNEETGLPQKVKDQCSYLLRIPGTGNIDSLNVSQAAALFLHEIFEA